MIIKKYFLPLLHVTISLTLMLCINGAQPDNQIDALLVSPLNVLNNIKITYEKFTQDKEVIEIFNQTNATVAQEAFTQKVQEYEKIHPLFLITECPHTINGFCDLARSHNAQKRDFFEKQTSEALSKKIRTSDNKCASYVGFGSGSSFSDFRVLAQALKKNQSAHLFIHLIDPRYRAYTITNNLQTIHNLAQIFKVKKLPSSSYHINHNENLPLSCLILKHTLLIFAMEKLAKITNPHDFTRIYKSILTDYLPLESQYQQFLCNLKHTFPQAKIELFIHCSSHDYLSHINTNSLPLADVIVASDIDDNDSKKTFAVKEYTQLCIAILKVNPDLYNGMFSRGQQPGIIEKQSVSLNKINNTSTAITSEDKTKIHGYLNHKPL